MSSTAAEKLVTEIVRLFPEFLADPVDNEMCQGNAAVCVIDPAGRVHGHIFGGSRERGRWYFSIATRKVLQVWATGFATGRFEELVYSGKLDEGKFGLSRPDFIGWQGGVPLVDRDGQPLAAAFSGFRGTSDIAIIEKALAAVPDLSIKRE